MESVDTGTLRPADFSRQMLNALDASEGRSKRRKRDQTPDTIGLGLKRALLLRAAEDDPPPEGFEAWLVGQVLAESASGGTRAMCQDILAEYRLAAVDSEFRRWLEAGAPSADAEDQEPRRPKRRETIERLEPAPEACGPDCDCQSPSR